MGWVRGVLLATALLASTFAPAGRPPDVPCYKLLVWPHFVEAELKVVLRKEGRDRFFERFEKRFLREEKLVNYYLDTPSGYFSKRRITIRLRKEGRRHLLTLKLPSNVKWPGEAPVKYRYEIEALISAEEAHALQTGETHLAKLENDVASTLRLNFSRQELKKIEILGSLKVLRSEFRWPGNRTMVADIYEIKNKDVCELELELADTHSDNPDVVWGQITSELSAADIPFAPSSLSKKQRVLNSHEHN